MEGGREKLRSKIHLRLILFIIPIVLFCGQKPAVVHAADSSPQPLLAKGQAVDWWFVFKFNSASFPGCGEGIARQCIFGGDAKNYKFFGQQFVYASSLNPRLQKGGDCAGDSTDDPIGATFNQVYNGSLHYVIWNDQFYDDPLISGCSKSCGAPWGHSKGLAAWDDSGAGFVMQVTTPSWPAAGSSRFPRATDGNTLGCVQDDNVEVSQQFFALKLTKDDLIKVLTALKNASVVTDPEKPQIVNNGGPEDIRKLVQSLGAKSSHRTATKENLSTGVELISKPSALHVPPWQMVSALLGGVSLRTATWWATPKIYTTTSDTNIACWDASLGTAAGPVEIATNGQWVGTQFGLGGGPGPNFNHAKIGVSTSGDTHFSIFGDMNQQGAISGNCGSSQNGRGGLFYVVDNATLSESLADLLKGGSAPIGPPSN